MATVSQNIMPCTYFNHGGGPMPLMGKQPEVANWCKEYGDKFKESPPKAIMVVSAHWEEDEVVKVGGSVEHDLYFDYYGFPSETYDYEYPAPGEPTVAAEAVRLLKEANVKVEMDTERGWDHGVFVPLMCMFPEAKIPVVPVSVLTNQDAKQHIAIGQALAPLREQGVLILGSGASFHNFGYFRAKTAEEQEAGTKHSHHWADWLEKTMTSKNLTNEERLAALGDWEQAPSARACQPPRQAEHLMPMFVIAGAARGEAAVTVGKKTEEDENNADMASKWAGINTLVMSQFEFLK